MAGMNADGDIVKWYRGVVAGVEAGAREELERTMKDGAELTIGYIMTRGTKESGKAGRIDDGDMVRDIDWRVDELANGGARGFFGWLNAANSPEKRYYVYQEGGFWHVNAGRAIEGMFAVTDAATQTFEDFKGRMASKLAAANAPQFTKRVVIGKKGNRV